MLMLRKMLSEDEHDLLLNATFQIIDSSLEPHKILDEACALSKRLKLENETSDSLSLTENYFSLFQQHGLGSRMEIPAPTLATQIINLSQECKHQENNVLLSDVLLAKFNTILCALKYQSKESFDANLFASMITKHELPLEILWNLHKCSALNLDVYLSSKLLNEASYTDKLAKKLFALFIGENVNQHRRQCILSAFAGCLVKKSFEEKKAPEKRACTQILDTNLRDFLEVYEDSPDINCLALPLPHEEQLQNETLKKFNIHALSFLLSYKTNFSVFQALTADTEWKSAKEFGVLRLLLKHLLLSLDVKEIASAMFRSLDQPHINPTTVFTLLSVMFMSYPQCKDIITDFIQSAITASLENSDFDKFCIGVLLARQSAVAGQVYFGRYVDWFESVFGNSCSTLVLTKPMFLMFVKFLSNLVPHESAEYLKVHITKKPHMPLKSKEVYDDYILLAKTRLRDLGVPLNDVFGRMYDPGHGATNSTTSERSSLDPVEDDLEKVLESYAQTGKIPTTVLEASIFRRPYFVGKFLPALLKPRFLPDEPDLKMKLIEEINKSGRIPTSLYNKYTAECEREKQNLFDGVFDVDDDDAMDALVLSPYEQLILQLDKYFEAVSQGNKVEEIISMMMETVSGILQNTKSQNSADLSSILIDFTKPLHIPEIELVKILKEKLLKVVGNVFENKEQQPQSFQVLQGVKKLFEVLTHHLPHTTAIIIQHLISNIDSQVRYNLLSYLVYQDEHHIYTLAWMFANLTACQPSGVVVTVKLRPQLENSHAENRHTYTNLIEAIYHCISLQKTVRLYFIYSCFMRYTHLALRLLDCEAQQREDADVFEVVPQLETEQLLPTLLVQEMLLLKMRFSLCERFLNQSHLSSQILPENIESSVTSNPIWKKLTSKLQPSLQDWISFEIKMDENCDSLSPSERTSVLWKISSQFLQSAKLSQKPLDFHSEMLRILAQNLATCSSEALCKGKKNAMEVIRKFINILKHHTSQLFQIGQVTENWIASTLRSFMSLPYTSSLLRILLELPPFLVFSNSPSKKISKSDVDSALYIVQQYCNSNHNEGGFLSLGATMYFMKVQHLFINFLYMNHLDKETS
ncbi:uncharacterized protein LOC131935440 [Physella acuta]|uniref:uncharacterized protein LOC131935440 n=1 Tax=Physella acuta TaxID=109671 RepID=UPI0027DD6023|nr:uncharacterized protein LOC131935440 [Physella acuta]